MAIASSAFLLAALRGKDEEEPQRLDGRRPFDARRLTIRFSRYFTYHLLIIIPSIFVFSFQETSNSSQLAPNVDNVCPSFILNYIRGMVESVFAAIKQIVLARMHVS